MISLTYKKYGVKTLVDETPNTDTHQTFGVSFNLSVTPYFYLLLKEQK